MTISDGGVNAVVVNEFVQEYLFSIWDARELVIRGQTASNGAGLHGHEATSTGNVNDILYYSPWAGTWHAQCSCYGSSDESAAVSSGRCL